MQTLYYYHSKDKEQANNETLYYFYLPASHPGANNVLKIATLQCFYLDQ
jgi:hypothetical protein